MQGGEDLIYLPDDVVNNMSSDQKICYKLVKAVKAGVLPGELQEMLCGTLNHSRWLTTAERIVFLWTRKHGLSGRNFSVGTAGQVLFGVLLQNLLHILSHCP